LIIKVNAKHDYFVVYVIKLYAHGLDFTFCDLIIDAVGWGHERYLACENSSATVHRFSSHFDHGKIVGLN